MPVCIVTSECAHHSCGYWQCDLSEALVQSRNFRSDFMFCRQCGMGQTMQYVQVNSFIVTSYLTLVDGSLQNRLWFQVIRKWFSILDGDESYWKLWTGMQLISSDIWPTKVQCALVSESADYLMLYSAVECCERKTFSNIDAMKLTQGPFFLPAQVPDIFLYQYVVSPACPCMGTVNLLCCLVQNVCTNWAWTKFTLFIISKRFSASWLWMVPLSKMFKFQL
jgi:hypothetical protein